MTASGRDHLEVDLIHVNVASAAGAYTVGSASFFRYILRLGELGLALSLADQEAVDVLAAVPHALGAEEDVHSFRVPAGASFQRKANWIGRF